MPDLRPLIRRGRDLADRIKVDEDELKKIKAKLIAVGEGRHEGTGSAVATVSFPKPSIKPDEDDVTFCRQLLEPDVFGKLFVEKTTVSPVSAFRQVLRALVPEPLAAEVIEHCEVENSPQVRFS